MRIGLTKYGLPQVVVFPTMILAAMGVVLWAGVEISSMSVALCIEVVLLVALLWILSFFRDPYREVPTDDSLLLSPADGKISDIETVDEPVFIGGKAVRIGVFLSIFNVHINRAPCACRVEKIVYKEGEFRDARSEECGQVNESNSLYLTRISGNGGRMIVRQVSGAIARRIVCATEGGAELAGGEQFGMIKFGSRTELYIPAGGDFKVLAKVGDNVAAGVTVMVKYRKD